MVDQDSIHLNGLNEMALALHPSGQAVGDLHTLLLQAIEHPPPRTLGLTEICRFSRNTPEWGGVV